MHTFMNFIELILSLAVAGFLVWLVLQIPMHAMFKNIIIGVTCFALVIWVLSQFGMVPHLGRLRVR